MNSTYLIAMMFLGLATSHAQSVSTPPKADEKKTETPTERELTKDEAQELQVTMLKIHLLNDKYRLDDYQKEVNPISVAQQKIRETLCKGLGVPTDKIQAECGITGFDNDGDPLLGPDGKPLPQKVIWVKQKPAADKK